MDAQKALSKTFELCDLHVQRGVTTPYDDVIHPACCTPNTSFHMTIILCAAVGVTFRIRANPFCVDRYVAAYNQEFVDTIVTVQTALTDEHRQHIKETLKNIHTSHGVFNNAFTTPRVLFDVINKAPEIKKPVLDMSFKMHRDACSKYPEFHNALWVTHKSVFGNMKWNHEGDHYCFNPVCSSCSPAADGIMAYMPVMPLPSSPSHNTSAQDSFCVASPARSSSPKPSPSNDAKKNVFDLFMNNLDNEHINWNHIKKALIMNGAK
jgi:hypothetical protein